MTQTLAIFYDAYRSLNARKVFWIALIMSLLVAGAFALVGINEKGISIFGVTFETLLGIPAPTTKLVVFGNGPLIRAQSWPKRASQVG